MSRPYTPDTAEPPAAMDGDESSPLLRKDDVIVPDGPPTESRWEQLKEAVTFSSPTVSERLRYCWLFVLWSIVAVVLRDNGEWLEKVPRINEYCEDSACFGSLAVYRVFAAVSVFFGAFALGFMGYSGTDESDNRVECQRGLFGLKWWMLFALTVGTFFLPNEPFLAFAKFGVWASGAFLLLQQVLLVSFGWSWNDNWHAKNSEDSQSWDYAILVAAVALYAGGITFIIWCYQYFSEGPECEGYSKYATIALAVGVIYTGIALSVEHGALLPSAVLFLYSGWLTFSALMSLPSECNSLEDVDWSESSRFWIGFAMTIGSVVYSCFSLSGSSADLLGVDEEAADDSGVVGYNYSYFHLVFVFAATYSAQLLTNWETVNGDDSDAHTAVWVKLYTSWACMALYTWTLVAPVLMPERFESS